MVNHPTSPGQRGAEPGRGATLIETDEDVRQALLAGLRGEPQGQPVPPPPAPGPAAGPGRTALPFRPTARPPVALLTVCDDGKTEGEVIRIRDPRFVIGRTEGDLRIPIDGRMSARHAEITLQTVGGMHRWVVTDLQSTHGMFVRVSRTVLADGAEFLVGGGRYRFEAAQAGPGPTVAYGADDSPTERTQGWPEGPGAFRPAVVTELLGREFGNRILLVKPEYWIGSDPSCPIGRPDDPFCEPRHVRLYRTSDGVWHAEHQQTQNGLWLRMPQIIVEAMVHFQVGEQRFRIKIR